MILLPLALVSDNDRFIRHSTIAPTDDFLVILAMP
jgi:hypothetical protein